MEMDSERYTFLADRFKVDRPKIIQVLFVDETLIKIGGLEYWPWIAYEHNMDVWLMMHLSRDNSHMLSVVLQAIKTWLL